jgi:hypothetical protein
MSDEITGTTNIDHPVFVYGEAHTHVWGNPVGVDLPFCCTVSPRRWWHRLMFWQRMPPRPNPDTPTR